MSRRLPIVLVAALSLSQAATAEEAPAKERLNAATETRPVATRIIAAPALEPRSALAAIFALRRNSQSIQTDAGFVAGMPALEVVVARIDTDGRPVLACVDSEEAGRRFLDAPQERIAGAAAKEK